MAQKNVKLSKSILDMKFMKRTKERVLKEADDAQGNAMYSDHITEEMRKNGNIIFIEASITNCLDLIDGRLSFGGMNPEIEKLMSNDYAKQLEEAEKKKETDINDEEMALINTMAKKFEPKTSRSKGKFLKPADD